MKTSVYGSLFLLLFAPALLKGQTAPAPPTPAAQESPSALPPGPILAEPEFAAWQVVTTRPGAAKQPDKESSKSEAAAKVSTTNTVTKTGNIRLEVAVDEEGSKLTKWGVGDAEVSQASGQPIMLLHGRSRSRKSTPQPTASPVPVVEKNVQTVDFPDVAWVSEKNFTGIMKMGGVDCLTFKDRLFFMTKAEINDAKAIAAKLKQDFDEEQFKEAATAYISLETRLPVAALRGKCTIAYKFLPTPTQPLAVPPEIMKLINLEETRQQDLARVPARS